MTQAELAEKLMVTPQAVSKWETGQSLPDAEQMLALSRLFAVTINSILAGGEPVAADQEAPAPAPPEAPAWHPDQEDPPPVAPADGRVSPDTVVGLTPFLEKHFLAQIIEQCDPAAFTTRHAVAVAPFVDTQFLDRMADHLPDITGKHLVALAPFLGRSSPATLTN